MARKSKRAYVRSEWVFDWKGRSATPLSTWLSIVLVAGIFAMALVSLRVKLVQPVEWQAPQASVIHLRGEGWSRPWVTEARAKGPFPSRFEPSEWSGVDGMQASLRELSKPRIATHQPRLLPFPDPGIQAPRMARRGEPVLPYRPLKIDEPDVAGELKVVPVIHPLDGIRADELPEKLPAWDLPLGEKLTGRAWKFLLELDSDGRVLQLVSLAGGQELSPRELSTWLRGVVFATKERRKEGPRWVAIALEFENTRLAK